MTPDDETPDETPEISAAPNTAENVLQNRPAPADDGLEDSMRSVRAVGENRTGDAAEE